jgi:hypothetical protein
MRVTLRRGLFYPNLTDWGLPRVEHERAPSDSIGAARAPDRRLAWPPIGMTCPLVVENNLEK